MTKSKFILFFLIAILFTHPKIYSLKCDNIVQDRFEKIYLFNDISNTFLTSNVDSAIFYAEKSYDLANFFCNETLAARSASLLGYAYISKENYEKALDYARLALEIYDKYNMLEEYVISLGNMGTIYCGKADYQKALMYYKMMYLKSNNIDNQVLYTTALDGIGTVYFLKGEYELSLKYLNSALLEISDKNVEYNRARLLYQVGAVYLSTYKFDQALDFFLNSIKIAEDNNDFKNLSSDYHAIGVIYLQLKNLKMAIKYNDIALLLAKKFDDKYIIGNFLSHSGEVYLQLSQLDSALHFAKKALNIQKEIKNKVEVSRVLNLIGDVYQRKNHYRKALEIYHEAKNLIHNIDQRYRHTKIAIHLGITYTKIGRYGIAQKYLNESLEDARKIKAQDLVIEGLSALSDYYATTNDYKKAYHYLDEYTHLNDSIFTTSSHHIAEMQMRYETGKREKENQLLKNKIEIQNLEIEKSNLQNWLSYLSLTIVSIVGFFSFHRYKAKKKANILLEQKVQDAIKEHQKQQEIIFHQANLSSLGELAAGMAHEINQPLQAIKLSTESLDLDIRDPNVEDSAIKENISEIYQSIDRAKSIIDHVRIFASQQKNHVKEFFNPISVVEKALSLIGKQYLKKEIFINLKLNNRVGKIRGNPYKYEQIIFNLLSNAKDALFEKEKEQGQKYRKEIDIEIYREENDLVLQIHDNGIGMSKNQQDNIFSPFYTTKNLGEGTGLGLSIVFGLVTEMNGRILVTSDFDTGTTVKVCIPKSTENKKTEKNSETEKLA